MRTSRLYSSAAVCAAFIGGVGLSAQLTSAMASLNPRDAVRAAPKNHKVLFENDSVRLLEVTIQPGETENMHLHQYSSVIAFNASTPTGRDRDAAGVITESQGKRLTGDVPRASPY